MKSRLTLDTDGAFKIRNVTDLSYTYFPLCNTHSMKSSITPALGGDAKVDQNGFLLLPTSVEDLEQSLMKRNVYFRVNDTFTWSITGQTPAQTLTPDTVDLHGDFLVHTVVRKHDLFTCTIESFVPNDGTDRELHRITMQNTGDDPLTLKSVVGVPLYGRSAENIRDHRHVTSLLNRIRIKEDGIINHPTFSFDERGHVLNHRHYGAFAKSSHHESVKRYHPTLEAFTGEGHTLLDPLVVKRDVASPHRIGDEVKGYEAMAGLEYDDATLEQDETLTIVLSLGISEEERTLLDAASELDDKTFEELKEATRAYWKKELSSLTFRFPKRPFNGWLKWVTLQPVLRRIYGNSFLPHHDYGRGGRGWRDLWQDSLALILMNPSTVRDMLINNFKGVRIDGSNATIIGDRPGEFLADRNHITRIWMDHGGWPLLTTKLYVDQSGDTDLLFEKVGYFRDQFTHYTKKATEDFQADDTRLETHEGIPYRGTVLEHLLIQNLVPFYNVGEHNNLRLEDADWNDGMDMAKERGESVAFTSFYGQNLITLSEMLEKLHQKGVGTITLLEEAATLLEDVPKDDIKGKHELLKRYFDSVERGVSGRHSDHDPLTLAKTLHQKGEDLLKQVRNNEWLEEGGDGWFNGYYDNDGDPLDDVSKKHMTLTGQVFAIMSGAATDKQVRTIIRSADRHLYSEAVGGYRLNTDFNELKTNMGRLFGFAYGHKENGAMFSHMALMYANALYRRGFVKAGYKVIDTIYRHSMDLDHARIYPGIPEYFNPRGRGMYSYLTGSASWMILTMVQEVFGVKSDMGLPVFEPKLTGEQFGDASELSIDTVVGKRDMTITYRNPDRLSYGDYEITDVKAGHDRVPFTRTESGVRLDRQIPGERVEIILSKKKQVAERELL